MRTSKKKLPTQYRAYGGGRSYEPKSFNPTLEVGASYHLLPSQSFMFAGGDRHVRHQKLSVSVFLCVFSSGSCPSRRCVRAQITLMRRQHLAYGTSLGHEHFCHGIVSLCKNRLVFRRIFQTTSAHDCQYWCRQWTRSSSDERGHSVGNASLSHTRDITKTHLKVVLRLFVRHQQPRVTCGHRSMRF